MNDNDINKSNSIPTQNQETSKKTSQVIDEVKEKSQNTLEKGNSANTLWENTTLLRITLVRHFPYDYRLKENKIKIDKYNTLLAKKINQENLEDTELETLSTLEKDVDDMIYKSFEEIPDEQFADYKEYIKTIFNQPWKTLIIYSEEWKKRVKLTWENLKEIFYIEKKSNVNLKWSNKSDHIWEIYVNMATNIKDELKNIIGKYLRIYNNIIIISNRSYSHWFNTYIGNRKISIKESEELFEKDWFNYIDINSKWEPISQNEYVLHISPKNYHEIKSIFEIYTNNSMIELQNNINTLFTNEHHLYSQYLTNEKNKSPNLHIFCISNLLKIWDYEPINTFIKTCNNKNIQELLDILNILTKVKRNDIVDELILKLWIIIKLRENINLELDKDLEEKCKQIKNAINKIKEKSKEQIDSIFAQSIDDMVKKREIINRQLYRYIKSIKDEEINETYINTKVHEETTISNLTSLEEILSNNDIFTYIFNGNVWEWKSTELAKIWEEINTNKKFSNTYEVIFYKMSEITTENYKNFIIKLEEISNLIEKYKNKKVIIILDWIDELPDSFYDENWISFKSELKNFILKWSNKNKLIIAWSRKWEFNDIYSTNNKKNKSNENVIHIRFKDIDRNSRNNFIKNRLINLWIKNIKDYINQINIFLRKDVLDEELKNTPLILFFLCVLSKNQNLKNIKNRAWLYEKIIIEILNKHQWLKKLKLNETNTPLIMKTLSFCAQNKFDKKVITEKNIETFLTNENPYLTTETKKEIISQIFLIYKSENQEYSFILQSFYEYFLAKYISNIPKWNKIIYKYKKELLNDKSLSPIIMFYWEILINEWRIDEFEKLIWKKWLLKNNSNLWEWFFIWLEMIYNFYQQNENIENSKNINKVYLNKIQKWDKYKTALKLYKFQEFQKKIWFKENEFINEYYKKIKEHNIPLSIEKKANLWTSTIINEIINTQIKIEEYIIIINALKKSWNEKWIKIIYNHAINYYKNNKNDILWLNILLEIWNIKTLNYIYKSAINEKQKLISALNLNNEESIYYILIDKHKWSFPNYLNTLIELAKKWHNKSVNELINIAEILYKIWLYDKLKEICIILVNSKNIKGINQTNYYASKLYDKKLYSTAIDLYFWLIWIWENKYYKKLINCIYNILEEYSYKHLSLTIKTIHDSIYKNYNKEEQIFELSEFEQIRMDNFYNNISKLIYICDNEIWIKYVYQILINILNNCFYKKTSIIQEELSSWRDMYNIKWKYEWNFKLIKKDNYIKMLLDLIIKLINKWRKWTEYAYKIWETLYNEWLYIQAWIIFIKLINIGEKEGIEKAKECANKIIFQNNFDTLLFLLDLNTISNSNSNSNILTNIYNLISELYIDKKYVKFLKILIYFIEISNESNYEKIWNFISNLILNNTLYLRDKYWITIGLITNELSFELSMGQKPDSYSIIREICTREETEDFFQKILSNNKNPEYIDLIKT